MRKYYIDNIRWMTIVLVVIYHVIYMFNGIIVEGVIGPITEVRCQDVVQYLLYPWFMVILFIISGMCAKYYLDDHSDREFIRMRTRKLLVPSTIGLLVFGWIQGYFNMAVSHAFDTMPDTIPGLFMYLIMVVSGTGVLWTIQVMWVLSMVLILVRRIEKGRLGRLWEKANMAVLIALVIPVWGAAQILNTPVICVYRFGIYGFCFLLGYYLFSHDTVISQLEKYHIPLFIAAAFAGLFYTYCYYGEDYARSPVVNCPLAILYAWLACLATIGCVKHWGDQTGALAQFMTKKNFGLYVFHYLPLSASAYFLTKYTQLNGVCIYTLTAIAAFGGSLLLYEIISRIPVLRWCVLGIKRSRHMFRDNLISLRKINHLSQEELADKLNISRQTLSKYETGESLPDIEKCKAMAEVFGVSLDDLVNYESDTYGLNVPPKGKHMFGMVKVGDKGQIVIPSKARKLFQIEPGDSLIVLGDEFQGLAIIKEEKFLAMVNEMRGV